MAFAKLKSALHYALQGYVITMSEETKFSKEEQENQPAGVAGSSKMLGYAYIKKENKTLLGFTDNPCKAKVFGFIRGVATASNLNMDNKDKKIRFAMMPVSDMAFIEAVTRGSVKEKQEVV